MQPVLFIGHGSPMNAIENNTFTKTLNHLGKKLTKPDSVLVISAHWYTHGTSVTYTDDNLETIHDFGGFPTELFNKQYHAKGSKKLAEIIYKLLKPTEVIYNQSRGLDHGAWSVMTHIFPDADIQVAELSIDATKPPQYHFDLGQKLSVLSSRNVLIIASGNVIHSFEYMDTSKNAKPQTWALDFQADFLNKLMSKNWNDLINFKDLKHCDKAINTADHYLPLFYVLGAAQKNSKFEVLNDEIQLGSMSMLSFKFGE